MKFAQKGHLQVKTDLSALTDVLSWFDQFNQSAIPHEVWLQVQLALAEGFTNAVRHAHKHQEFDTPIDIEVVVFEQTIEMRIWDSGGEFDLNSILQTLPLEMDQESEGGRGLKLMKRVADCLTYTRTSDARNCLLITKHYS